MTKKTTTYQWVFGFLASLFIFITTLIYFVKGHINSNDLEFTKLGTYGDFIGGSLGTILSIVAVILVYRTYISQKEELSMSRRLLEQQQFENTFFNMLKVHQDLKNNLSFNTEKLIVKKLDVSSALAGGRLEEKGYIVTGRSFFQIASEDFHKFFYHFKYVDRPDIINNEINKKTIDAGFGLLYQRLNSKQHLKEIKFKYDLFFSHYANYLGDYFRNLYHILKFISQRKSFELKKLNNQSTKEEIELKYKTYADIIQSQMNFSELQLTFYNSFKFRKVRKLVKEFNFVENLHSSNLLDEYHMNFKSIGNIKTD